MMAVHSDFTPCFKIIKRLLLVLLTILSIVLSMEEFYKFKEKITNFAHYTQETNTEYPTTMLCFDPVAKKRYKSSIIMFRSKKMVL